MRVINQKMGTKQNGLIVVLFTISLLVILGFAALAIDINHMILNKSRVQNGVDSAALSASVALENGASISGAATAAITTIKEMAAATGNDELDFDVSGTAGNGTATKDYSFTSSEGTVIKVQFSNNPITFPAVGTLSTVRDVYTRVAVESHGLDSYFLQIFGISKSVRASAVAGRSAGVISVSNLAPIGICDKSSVNPGSDTVYGYETGLEHEIAGKEAKCKNAKKCTEEELNAGDIGPGNYNFLQLQGYGNGKSLDGLQGALGGNPPSGFDDDETGIYFVGGDVDTETGAGNGPATAINSRFVDTEGFPDGDDDPGPNLMDEYNSTNFRRQIVVPIVDCSVSTPGSSLPVTISGFACILLTQQYDKDDKIVYGEFYKGCTVPGGGTGQNPTATGPYKIQLYRDMTTGDS
ncbi:hypothetical protein BCT86_13820 [Vibrio breoganii]|uniref:TadE/TadG family type IV pilus assembly protein n=1 Tax=Vibrio breoganii TaxID=553239 RepID=UPI000C83C2EA|nr:TadE/TadG family type IV pilus assembly protein [Vibrio breoganii]PML05168.1 hypothetical protein BCT86_13820 [Vibrio breoganii]